MGGGEGAGAAADDEGAFAGDFLAVVVAEDAGDFGEFDGSVTGVGDGAEDFDEAGVDVAFGRLHVDVVELQVGEVGTTLGGELWGRGGSWGGAKCQPAEEAEDACYAEGENEGGGRQLIG